MIDSLVSNAMLEINYIMTTSLYWSKISSRRKTQTWRGCSNRNWWKCTVKEEMSGKSWWKWIWR